MTRARTSGGTGYEHLAPLLAQYAALEADHSDKERLRDELVTGYLPVAQHIARRFARRGEPQDDLEQVATVGLINAVDRFDPTRGVDFLTYAVPTITGEVRRHFRDQAWQTRVPRRLKDLHVSVGAAVSELYQRNGRAPTARELAEHLDVPREEVLEALQAAQAYRGTSLDELLSNESGSGVLADTLGEADTEMENVEYRQSLQPLVSQLPERERTILMLRFFGDLTQSQIAERTGISQMHVSRLLSRTLEQLREQLRS